MSAKIRTAQIAVTAVAVPLSAVALEVKAFVLKNPTTNAHAIFFGDSAVTLTTGFPILPGEEFEFEYTVVSGAPVFDIQPQDVFVVGTAGDTAAWVSAGR